MAELKNVIADNISDLRKKAGMTQLELAERINYSDKAISKWERGEGIPDVTVLAHLSDIFGVNLDYFIREDHAADTEVPVSKKKKQKRSIITALSVSLVWLIATILFVTLGIARENIGHSWLSFVFAVPVTAIVILVFNSVWGNRRKNYPIISVLVWSFLIAVFSVFALSGYSPYLWLIFVLGIPAQIIILLWSGLGKKQ